MKVSATSINPIEWKMRQGLGLPHWLWRKLIGNPMILGLDFGGTVVATGSRVTNYGSGDEVMGALPLSGAYREYLRIRPRDPRIALAAKPPHVSMEEAAALPFAGLVAYSALLGQGALLHQSCSARILIVGGSGGVGHLAVQMAKRAMNADFVAAVSSSRNTDFVERCGADLVIPHDYVSAEQIAFA